MRWGQLLMGDVSQERNELPLYTMEDRGSACKQTWPILNSCRNV